MISILINIHVLVVESRDTSRKSVLTMKTRRKLISKEKGEENPRKPT